MGGDAMREELIRTNIVLTREQHIRFKQYAKRYHGSLSQFLRLSAENEINDQKDTNDFHLRPIIEKIGQIQQELKQLSTQLHDFKMRNAPHNDSRNSIIQSMALEAEHLLLSSDTPLTIPEINEYLSYPPEQIIQSIEWLLDRGYIERIHRVNAPSKWKIRGDPK
jgi:hypothetical protein